MQGQATALLTAALLGCCAADAAALQQDGTGAGGHEGRWLTARVTEPVRLRATPAGRTLARLRTRTEFGSPRVLGVVRRRRGWLQVVATERRDNRYGWVPADSVRIGDTDVSVHVDRSRRLVSVRRASTVVQRFRVAVGSPASPTPTGRFAVTDLLRMGGGGSPYGCCAVALSGHQPNLLPDWNGGDRLAIHGTAMPETIGRAMSRGCLRARDRPLRSLMRTVPLGAPVFVRT